MLENERYKKQSQLTKETAIKQLRAARKNLIDEFRLTLLKDEVDFLENFDEVLAHMYINPKIHKSKQIIEEVANCETSILSMAPPTDLPFRPIISGTKCPLKRLSSLVHKLLEPYPKMVNSYVKDSWDLLRKLPSTAKQGTEIISIYTIF